MQSKISDFPINSNSPFPVLNEEYKPIGFIDRQFVTVDIGKLSKLNNNGLFVLKYINHTYSVDSKHIHLDGYEIEKYLFEDPNKSTSGFVYRGILNLLDNDIIARGITKDWYWINNDIIWKKK